MDSCILHGLNTHLHILNLDRAIATECSQNEDWCLALNTWYYFSSAECKKVVSDIFGEIEFLMEYEDIGLYAHFALFSKFLALLFSKILSKMCSKNATYDPIALIVENVFNARGSQVPITTLLHQLLANVFNARTSQVPLMRPVALHNWYP